MLEVQVKEYYVQVSAGLSAQKEMRIGFIKITDLLMSEVSFLHKDTRSKESALQTWTRARCGTEWERTSRSV